MNFFGQQTFPITSLHDVVDIVDLSIISDHEIEEWNQLGVRAMCANPFVESDFVIPLVHNLRIPGVGLLRVRDKEGGWKFVTPVVQHYYEQGRPLPELRALSSKYTFIDQPLVSKIDPVLTLTSLFGALSNQRQWHGLGVEVNLSQSDQSELTDFAAVSSGVECHPGETVLRPVVVPASAEELLSGCSGSRRKSLRKSWKLLESYGKVEYRLARTAAEIPQAVEQFLRLESSGWKGEKQTSLDSHANDHRFFLEMCENFSQTNRCLFGELLLNGSVIASTCNLLSQQTLFAFKIGWDPNLSKCSLGHWSELLLADEIAKQIPEITLIDSCSNEDSYVGRVWHRRQQLASRLYVWSRRARIVQGAKSVAKAFVKRSV